jgi:hypothetical protein
MRSSREGDPFHLIAEIWRVTAAGVQPKQKSGPAPVELAPCRAAPVTDARAALICFRVSVELLAFVRLIVRFMVRFMVLLKGVALAPRFGLSADSSRVFQNAIFFSTNVLQSELGVLGVANREGDIS